MGIINRQGHHGLTFGKRPIGGPNSLHPLLRAFCICQLKDNRAIASMEIWLDRQHRGLGRKLHNVAGLRRRDAIDKLEDRTHAQQRWQYHRDEANATDPLQFAGRTYQSRNKHDPKDDHSHQPDRQQHHRHDDGKDKFNPGAHASTLPASPRNDRHMQKTEVSDNLSPRLRW